METENIRQKSARIYSFPTSPRIAKNKFNSDVRHAAEVTHLRRPFIMAESGWYHDDAIKVDTRRHS